MSQIVELFTKLRTASDKTFEGVVTQCRTTRELGQHYKQMGRKMSCNDVPTDLWDEHYREHLAWRANLFCEVPEGDFEKFFKCSDSVKLKFCVGRVRSKALAYRKRARQERLARVPLKTSGVKIYQADIANVLQLKSNKKAAAIITDPPYPHEYLGCWSELMKFAGRVLQDRGWLVAMSGQRWLPEVFERMNTEAKKAGLRYCWTLALHTPGQGATSWIGGGETDKNNPDVPQIGIQVQWKPILVYIKGKDLPTKWEGTDFLTSPGNDKEYHGWGQNVAVFEELVNKFTSRNELIVDPFLGGGTTAVAAFSQGRAFEGFDIEETAELQSLERLQLMENKEAQCG